MRHAIACKWSCLDATACPRNHARKKPLRGDTVVKQGRGVDLVGTCMIEGGSEIHSSQMLPVRLEEAGKLDGKGTRV